MTDGIKFNDGKLKVMQVSDLQDTKSTCVDTLRFIDAALGKVKPDLIILTGDQLDVAGLWGKGEKSIANVRRAIRGLFSVFENHGIPYALTFGNHDEETGVSIDEQVKIYSELKNCICFDNLDDGRPDAGTYNIPIFSSDGTDTVMNFYVFDTHRTKIEGEFEGLDKAQLEWYLKTSERLRGVPSMAFQHIPPDEIYELLTEVKKGTKGALAAYGGRSGKYYTLNSDKIKAQEAFGETPSVISARNKEFSVMRDRGDVFGIYFGHDHYNSFVGNVSGIDLGYCPGAGYNTYGLKHRAVRVFEFDENDVRAYRTYTVDAKSCNAPEETAPIRNFIYCHAPSCVGEAKAFALKCAAALAAVIILLVLAARLVGKAIMSGVIVGLIAGGLIYAVVAFVYNKKLRKKIIGRR